MTTFQQLTKMMTAMITVLMVSAAIVGFIPQLRKYQAHEKRLTELREDKTREELRLQDLRVRQDRFHNDRDYVRKVAHEIGLVEPDEMVFRFYDENRVSTRSSR
ncbi:MAG: septum formation initiator family protein [Kiritimatiellae bacterium]|jgi:cell division protein FtsB|nr:septum formation initiator family protein [Kiritimatiellia bacterium]